MLSFRTIAGLGLFSTLIGIKGLIRGRPRPVSLDERLAALPLAGAPVEAPVVIRWNAHQVPWIEARHDHDLAAALGVVHAHLRLAQIEIMRRIAQGRIAEAVGPAAIELDRALRIMDVGRAVPDILAAMPAETRVWLERFADGLNHVIRRAPRLPPEFGLLGLRPEPWSAADLVQVSRLAAADFTWRVWLRLLRLRGRPDWLKLWQRLTQENAPVPSLAGGGAEPPALGSTFDWALGAFGRHGSNAMAVAAARSASGGALLASDPHLGLGLPNLWLIVGCRSPGFNVVGLMVPGIPAFGLGRNAAIGWGGTSLHAASSDLFDLSELRSDEIRTRRERIAVRWWPDKEIEIRDTDYGPVVSDSPILPAGDRRLGMHWVGHLPTDDLSALLAVNRARNWREFHDALDGLGIPALNMVYADAQGHVGQAMAARLPRRPPGAPLDLFATTEARRHWESFVTARDLPATVDPPSRFVASANNRPESATVAPVGFFFSPDDRVIRMRQLVGAADPASVDDLKAAQRDVFVPSALALRDLLLRFAAEGAAEGGDGALLAAMREWDGHYRQDSRGALAFELVVYHFVHALHGKEDLAIYGSAWDPWSLIREDIATVPRERLDRAMARAVAAAAPVFGRLRDWGDAHRLRLSHILGAVPLLGRRYRFADIATGGSNETLMKTAHGFSGGRHAVRLGANARYISDFADPDANLFVLLGGQDGWLGSTTFLDQLALWRRGDYIRVPLRPEAARASFPYETVLEPGGE